MDEAFFLKHDFENTYVGTCHILKYSQLNELSTVVFSFLKEKPLYPLKSLCCAILTKLNYYIDYFYAFWLYLLTIWNGFLSPPIPNNIKTLDI